MADRFDAVMEVDGMIRDAEQRLAILRELRERLAARQEQAPAPPAGATSRCANSRNGKPDAAPPHAANGTARRAAKAAAILGKRVTREERMKQLAEHVLREGPFTVSGMVKRLGFSPSMIYGGFKDELADSGYFELESDGYHLTAKGRQWIMQQTDKGDD